MEKEFLQRLTSDFTSDCGDAGCMAVGIVAKVNKDSIESAVFAGLPEGIPDDDAGETLGILVGLLINQLKKSNMNFEIFMNMVAGACAKALEDRMGERKKGS